MSGLDAFPNGKLVAYDPKGQWDGASYELGKVVGRSASRQYVYVEFNGDDLGAKAVSPALLMPLTPAGEGPDLPRPDETAENPRARIATTDEAAYELYGTEGASEQIDRGDGSVLHRGRVFIPIELAERATQTTIEVLLPADRMNGVHLAPGATHEHRDWMPALVRYTGAEPPRDRTHDRRIERDIVLQALRSGELSDAQALDALERIR